MAGAGRRRAHTGGGDPGARHVEDAEEDGGVKSRVLDHSLFVERHERLQPRHGEPREGRPSVVVRRKHRNFQVRGADAPVRRLPSLAPVLHLLVQDQLRRVALRDG